MSNNIVKFILLFLLMACKGKEEPKVDNVEILPLASCVNNGEYQLEKLSDYAKSLHYIPLETNTTSMIGRVKVEESFFGNNNFYLHSDDKLYKFSGTGKFLSQIGKHGGGPGEYVNIWDVDIDFSNDKLYIKNREISILEYNTNGDFIRNIPLKSNLLEKGYYTQHFQQVSPELFFFEIVSYLDNQYMGMLSDDSFEKLEYVLSSDPIPLDDDKNVVFVVIDAKMYKTGKDIYFHQLRSDTIYQINTDSLCLTPQYVLDYGRYKYRDNNSESISSYRVIDSEKYIYWGFTFRDLAPEPFIHSFYRDGRLITYTDTSVKAVYNKKTKTFKLLKQPIPKQFGLLNDLDEGVPFWPDIISSDGKSMFMLCPAETFIATYSGKENLSDEVKNILSQIDEESNPVIVRADFK